MVTHSLHDRSTLEGHWTRVSPAAPSFASILMLLVSACNSDAPSSRPPRARPDQIPASILLPATSYSFGFASGRTTTPVSVAAFAITKTPITVGQYKQCVASRACVQPALNTPSCKARKVPVIEGATYDPSGNGDGLPLTCVKPADAARYCEWVGGSLPTIEQWVYAARGPEIEEFAWGRALPDCAKHQRASPAGGCCTLDACDPDTYYSVGQRPDVSPPTRLWDVLLTPGELLRNHSGAALGACSTASGACVVRGLVPGAIDGAIAVSSDINGDAYADPGVPSGFRCTFEVKP